MFKKRKVRKLKEYESYSCRSCGKSFIILESEHDKERYLKCPHCSSRKIKLSKTTDNLKECMKAHSYKREKGAIRQVN